MATREKIVFFHLVPLHHFSYFLTRIATRDSFMSDPRFLPSHILHAYIFVVYFFSIIMRDWINIVIKAINRYLYGLCVPDPGVIPENVA